MPEQFILNSQSRRKEKAKPWERANSGVSGDYRETSLAIYSGFLWQLSLQTAMSININQNSSTALVDFLLGLNFSRFTSQLFFARFCFASFKRRREWKRFQLESGWKHLKDGWNILDCNWVWGFENLVICVDFSISFSD